MFRRQTVLIPGKRWAGRATGQVLRVSVLVPLVLVTALLGVGTKLRWEQDTIIPLPTHIVATATGITIDEIKGDKVYYHLWCNPFPYADTIAAARVVAVWEQPDIPPVTDERIVRTATPWDCGTDTHLANGVLRVPEMLHGDDIHLRLGMEWRRPGAAPDSPPAAHVERFYTVSKNGTLRRA